MGDGKDKPSEPRWDREIDVDGNLLMPGFKNAHAHSAMTFLRSFADDLPLQEWLTQQVFPMEAKLTPEHIYEFTRLAIMEYLSSGITAAADMYLDPDAMAQAGIDCGFRTVMVGAVNNFVHSLTQAEAWYKKYQNHHPLIRYQLGVHAEYTCDRELLYGMADLANQLQAPVFCHNAETRREEEECQVRNGVTPTVFLEQMGMYRYGGGGYHCLYLTSEDREIFKERGLYAVTNPGSNAKLASGIAPIRELLAQGIHVSIGTDGPASNNALDMFREMYLTAVLAKIREQNAAAMDADKVLHMATVEGAHSMGLTHCDVLAAGKAADLICIDLHQPNMQPIHHISKNLVYSGSKSNVRMTMIAGRILYENGEFFQGEDPRRIYARSNELVKGMLLS